jgi:hypothetical protein
MKHTKIVLAALAAMSLTIPACGGDTKKTGDEKKPEAKVEAGKDAKPADAKPAEPAKPVEAKPEEAKPADPAAPPAGGAAAPPAEAGK